MKDAAAPCGPTAEPAVEAENVTVTDVRLQNTISSAGVERQ